MIYEQAHKLGERMTECQHKLAHVGSPLFEVCVEVFAEPAQVKLQLILLVHKPYKLEQTYEFADPTVAPLRKVIFDYKPGADPALWRATTWHEVALLPEPRRTLEFKETETVKRPHLLIVLFGSYQDKAHDQIDLPELLLPDGHEADLSLPAILKVLIEGTKEEKIAMLLRLHKRNYHKQEDELRKILRRAGVPLRMLVYVKDAIKLCDICRRWAATGTMPAVSLQLATSFNQLVHGDVLFFRQWAFLMLIDDATRFTVFWFLLHKDFLSIERAFRRSWIGRFGPCRKIRIDAERALA